MRARTTTVHLLRHGEVHNPEGVLYGRLPGFHLSDLGREMADQVARRLADRDIVHLVASPLERARETAGPLAAARGLDVHLDPRVTEATSVFEGRRLQLGDSLLTRPGVWRHLWNPLRPSWGEPFREVADRVWPAVIDARGAARGREAVVVSHQLPIWVTRLRAQGHGLVHDPRRRQCTLASLTSLVFEGDRLARVDYCEPVADLLPAGKAARQEVQGGA